MRDMTHSICLIKLYQITMRKKFRFFVSDYLKCFDMPLLSSGLFHEKVEMTVNYILLGTFF